MRKDMVVRLENARAAFVEPRSRLGQSAARRTPREGLDKRVEAD